MPTPLIPSKQVFAVEKMLQRIAQAEPKEISSPAAVPDLDDQVLVSRLIKLGKYRKLINDLKASAKESNGIINFVTGDETGESALVNAILSEAFDSTKIYRNTQFDASLWGKGAIDRFETLIDGSEETMSKEEIERRLLFCEKNNKRPEDANRCLQRSLGLNHPIDIADARLRRKQPAGAAPAAPHPQQGGLPADALGAGQPAAPRANPLLEIFRVLDQIEVLKAERSQLIERMAAEESENIDLMQEQIDHIDRTIEVLRLGTPPQPPRPGTPGLPRTPDSEAETVTDRSGFAHLTPPSLKGLRGEPGELGSLRRAFSPTEFQSECLKRGLPAKGFSALRYSNNTAAIKELKSVVQNSAGQELGRVASRLLGLLTGGGYSQATEAWGRDIDINDPKLVELARKVHGLKTDEDWNDLPPTEKQKGIRIALLQNYLDYFNLPASGSKGPSVLEVGKNLCKQFLQLTEGDKDFRNVMILRNPHMSSLVREEGQAEKRVPIFGSTPGLRKLTSQNETFSCPFHSTVHSYRPGQCPKCKANLVKGTTKCLVVVSPKPLVFEDANADVITMANTPVDGPEASVLIQQYFHLMNLFMEDIGEIRLYGSEERSLSNLIVGKSFAVAKQILHTNLAQAVFRINQANSVRLSNQDKIQGFPFVPERVVNIVSSNKALNYKVEIPRDGDGTINYPPLGKIQVVGLKAPQVAQNIQAALQAKNQKVTIEVSVELPLENAERFDGKEFVKVIRKANNRKNMASAKAADPWFTFFDRTDIEWPRYVYDKTSDFGKGVERWKNLVFEAQKRANAVIRLKENLQTVSDRLSALGQAPAKATPAEQQALETTRMQLQATFKKRSDMVAIAQRNEQSAMADIPHFIILYGEPGVGKCLGRGTPVMMFDGSIKAVEQVVAGELLMGPDSKPRTVLSTTTGVGPLYKVTQNNGDDFVCNDAHILSLQKTGAPSRNEVGGEPIFITAEEYCKKPAGWKHRHKGWKTGVEFPPQAVPIDPYWVGLWLGDGTSRIATITVAEKDTEIAAWLDQWAKDTQMFVRKEPGQGCSNWHFTCRQGSGDGENKIKNMLRDLNLLQNKHIPQAYWKNSESIRLQLLAGLIDSDGYKCVSGSVQFTNVNKRLAEDVLRLSRSLGFRTTFAEGTKGIKRIGYKVKAYTVTIGGTLSRIPSRLVRKQGHDNPQKRSLRYGIKVQPIGDGEYFGFTIDGDRQFLLGDYTVTHNTIFAHFLASLGNFEFAQLKLEIATGPLVGQHEINTESALKSILQLSDTVLLMDEFDGAGAGKSSTQANDPNAHHKARASLMLNFFGDAQNKTILRKRNVYIVATTNNGAALRGALRERAEMFEVPRPSTPEGVELFLEGALKELSANAPDTIPCMEGKVEDRANIEILERYWNPKAVDMKTLADVLFKTKINFRRLGEWCGLAFVEHAKYMGWQEKIALYQKAQTDPVAAEDYYLNYADEVDYDPDTHKLTAKPGTPATADTPTTGWGASTDPSKATPSLDPKNHGCGFPLNNATLLYAAKKTKVKFNIGDGKVTDNDCQWDTSSGGGNGVLDLSSKYWSNPDVIKEQIEAIKPDDDQLLFNEHLEKDVLTEDSADYPDVPWSGQVCTSCGAKIFAGEGGNATCPNCGELRKMKKKPTPTQGTGATAPTAVNPVNPIRPVAPAVNPAVNPATVQKQAPAPTEKKSSSDYYYNILVKAGLAQPMAQAAPLAAVPTPAPQTKWDPVNENIYDYQGILLVPVRSPRAKIQ